MISWPGISGSFGCVRSPSTTCRSVRHTAQAVTLIRICPSPGTGSGSSFNTSGAPAFSNTIARMKSSRDYPAMLRQLARKLTGASACWRRILEAVADADFDQVRLVLDFEVRREQVDLVLAVLNRAVGILTEDIPALIEAVGGASHDLIG